MSVSPHAYLPGRQPFPCLEPLEQRTLLASVAAVHFTGTEQDVTGIVLTFDAGLDPTSAQEPRAYFVGRRVEKDHAWFDPFEWFDPPRETRRVALQSAVYDDAARTVTLTPAQSFELADRFRRVRVSGRGEFAVRDAAGVPIDGNNDGVPGDSANIRFRVTAAKRLVFRDAEGDRAKLRLSGPGKLLGVVPVRREIPPVVFLNRTNALRSGLVGFIKQSRQGDGIVTIRQLTGTSFAAVGIISHPGFRVEIVTP